jgi:hypothetical protein
LSYATDGNTRQDRYCAQTNSYYGTWLKIGSLTDDLPIGSIKVLGKTGQSKLDNTKVVLYRGTEALRTFTMSGSADQHEFATSFSLAPTALPTTLPTFSPTSLPTTKPSNQPTVFKFSFNIGNNGFDIRLGKHEVSYLITKL